MLGIAARVRLFLAHALFMGLLLSSPARAHHITPNPVILHDLNGQIEVTVADCCGCSAVVTAVSLSPNIFLVNPGQDSGTVVKFIITPVFYGVGFLSIHIEGQGTNPQNEPCEEVSTTLVPVIISGPPQSAANTVSSTTTRDPINTFSGELLLHEDADLQLGGPVPIEFRRHYSSRFTAEGMIPCGLGENWTHNYNTRLLEQHTAVPIADVVTAEGRVLHFEKPADTWVLIEPLDIAFQLAEDNEQFVLGDPRTRLLTYYDSNGRPYRISNGKGANVFLYHGARGELTQVTDFYRTLSFTYDGNDLLSNVSDGTHNITFDYVNGRLTSATDAAGEVCTYAYTETDPRFGGLLTGKTLPEGNTPYTQAYDASGRCISQTDAYGNTYQIAYFADRTEMTDPLLHVATHYYAPEGRLTARSDETGNSASLHYDENGRRNEVVDRTGETNTVAHAPNGEPSQVNLANGASASITYASHTTDGITFADVSQITFPDGSQNARTYDMFGNVLTVSSRVGGTTTYAGYNASYPGSITTALGGTYSFSYNGNHTIASITDPAGHVSSFEYDNSSRVTLANAADGTSVGYAYDELGRLIASYDENGNATYYAYDGNGNLKTMTDRLGQITTYGYDLMDRLISITDPLGHAVSRTYDALGRVETLTDRMGNVITNAYDSRGNLVHVTGPDGFDRKFAYDEEGNLISERDPLGNETKYGRDALGYLDKVTTPRMAETSIEHDVMSRPTRLHDPVGNTLEFEYDAHSRLIRATQPGPEDTEVRLSWDVMDNLTSLSDPLQGDWQNEHDSQGRLTLQRDPLGAETTYAYDTRNRVNHVVFPAAMGTLDITYTPTGRVAQQNYSDGTVIDFTYDDAEQPLTATGAAFEWDARGDMTRSNGIDIARDADGRVATVTYSAGKSVTYTYDTRGRLTEIADWAGGGEQFAYDAAGRCTSITRSNGVATTKGYDADGNVVSIHEVKNNIDLASHILLRDLKGQVVRATRTGVLQPALPPVDVTETFNAASESAGWAYDALGRVTTRGSWTHTWDLAGRMTSYTHGAESAAYTYDADGHLLTRTQNAKVTSYTWNYAMQFPALSIEDHGVDGIAYYIYSPSGQLQYSIEPGGGARHFYHFDESGNTVLLTNDAGSITDRYAYTPLGAVIGREGATGNPFSWQGAVGQFDEGGSGLYLMRARWYDADAGRFLSRDPERRSPMPVENNPYVYARNNPLNFVDPLGRRAKVIASGIHTDIEVDIWDGGRIIGNLHMGFFPKIKKDPDPGYLTCLWNGIRGLTVGAESIFEVRAAFGGGVGTQGNADTIILDHGQAADDRLARAMLKNLGYDPGDGSIAEAYRKLMADKARGGRKSFFATMDASNYGWYRVTTQVCNDFTDDMLDIYYGYNWYTGPIWFGSSWTGADNGLIDDLRDHEKRLKDAEPAVQAVLEKLTEPGTIERALDLLPEIPLPF